MLMDQQGNTAYLLQKSNWGKGRDNFWIMERVLKKLNIII
jgi:hypothetical protein